MAISVRFGDDIDTLQFHASSSPGSHLHSTDHRPPLQCIRGTIRGGTTLLVAAIVARRWGLPIMLRWALFFFIISIIAGLFGFTGISVATAGIARILFFIAIVVFLAFLVLALLAGNTIL